MAKKIAKVGQLIEWQNPKFPAPLQGQVLIVRENSVCVEILNYTSALHELFANNRTVVNHKRYTILSEQFTEVTEQTLYHKNTTIEDYFE